MKQKEKRMLTTDSAIRRHAYGLPLAFVLGFIYRVVMGLQGVDTVDVGFCNTFYQVIFPHPDSNSFNFLYYLTGLLGGLWERQLGQFGLVGFRILEAACLSAAVYLLYKTFRHAIRPRMMLAAVSLSFLFPTIIVTFHYDTLSYLLIAASAYAYGRAMRTAKRQWLLAAGVMIGLSFFARIVNLTLMALALVPLIGLGRGKGPRFDVRSAIWFLSGIVAAALLMLCLMLVLHQMPYYLQALDMAFGTLADNQATHSQGNLFFKYFKGAINVALLMVAVAALAWGYDRWSGIEKRRHLVVTIVLGVVFLVTTYTSLPYTMALSLSLVLCFGLFRRISDGVVRATVVYLLMAALLFPFGSDIGIAGVYNWCAGLTIFPAVYCAQQLGRKWCGPLVWAYTSIALCAVLKLGLKAYGSSTPRYRDTVLVQKGRLNVRVDPASAIRYQDVIGAIVDHRGDNRLLLLLNQKSEIYYATGMLPFLGHTQTVIYIGRRLDERLDERKAHFGRTPLVVYIKGIEEMRETAEVCTVVFEWMKRNRYVIAYEDRYCTVYRSADEQ